MDHRVDELGHHAVVAGPLVYPASHRLEALLDELDLRASDRLIVDLRRLTLLDSSGLAGVLSAYVRARRDDFELVVVRPPPESQRLFELTGVDVWLTMVAEPSELMPRPG